jgi:SAM-dependent methyltransferase
MSTEVLEAKICEVCGNNDLTKVLDLGLHPMCDDLVAVGDARKCKEYPIEIIFCKKCLTAHQRFQVPKHDLFPVSYHYRSRFTADVLNGMMGLVDSCETRLGSLKNKKVLDIGCNDGSLLDFFKKKGAETFGIEPTGAYSDAKQKGHTVYNQFLSEKVAEEMVSANGKPDVITFTNVFAHIEDLHQVIRSLKILMTPKTVIVIENHYLGAVLDKNQFDTFYHEHPRTYSYTSFVHMASSLGVQLLSAEFPSRYGGNIRVFLGNGNENFKNEASISHDEIIQREKLFPENFKKLNTNMQNWILNKKEYINTLVKQYGPLRAKAFPGRAAILIKLLNLDKNSIAAVYEKPGSLKIGHYLPGTRIPICSDDDLFALENKTLPILNLAWHIPSEIKKYLSENNYTGQVIDVLEEKDFKQSH